MRSFPPVAIPDISTLLGAALRDMSDSDLYENFCAAQSAAFHEVGERVMAATQKGESELYRLAVELSIEANARKSAAERILSSLSSPSEK